MPVRDVVNCSIAAGVNVCVICSSSIGGKYASKGVVVSSSSADCESTSSSCCVWRMRIPRARDSRRADA